LTASDLVILLITTTKEEIKNQDQSVVC